MRTATRKWRKVETRPPIRIDPSPSPPFSPRLEKPAAFLSGGKEEGGKKKKGKEEFPIPRLTVDADYVWQLPRMLFYIFLFLSLSLESNRTDSSNPLWIFFPRFFVFFAVLFLLFLILSQRILDNCRCLGIRSYVGFIRRKYGVIILRLGRRRDIARFIYFIIEWIR